jgi:hypothetical protein
MSVVNSRDSTVHSQNLAPDVRIELQTHAQAIQKLGKRVVAEIIEIGRHLSEARALFGPRGDGWDDWLTVTFGWRKHSAQNFMRVYELSEQSGENFARLDIPVSALYLLAKPSTPSEARAQVLTRAESGERLLHKDVATTVRQAKSVPALVAQPPIQDDDEDDADTDAEDHAQALKELGVSVVLTGDVLFLLDTWIAAQGEPKPSRDDAVNGILQSALTRKPGRPAQQSTNPKAAPIDNDSGAIH